MRLKKGFSPIPVYQNKAVLLQAGAIQNQWYTVLTETNVRVYHCTIAMQTLAETVEMRLTIDGIVLTDTQAAIAGTPYTGHIQPLLSTPDLELHVAIYLVCTYAPIDCRTFKMEIRKTTNNGANRLDGWCNYSKFVF